MMVLGIAVLMIPIAFMTLCWHAVQVFPKKMQEGQVRFLQAYAFLFSRCRTKRYWYGLVHMLRSLVLAVIPIFPDVFIQIMMMVAVLICSLIYGVSYRPWRVSICNVVDTSFTVLIVLILICAAFFTDVDPSDSIAWLGSTALMSVFLVVPASLVFVMFKRLTFKNKKQFQFFISHHKLGAGSFARLLKMELGRSQSVGREVYLDCDHLVDLDVLFDQVASLTETVIIVASKEFFLRVWCVVEITVAQKKGLNVIKVTLPDFEELDDDFINNYLSYMPDLTTLSNNGLTLQDAQDALRWSRHLQNITVLPKLSNEILTDVVKQILDEDGLVNHLPNITVSDARTYIICNWTDLEAASTALILECLLRPMFAKNPMDFPHVLRSGMQVPTTAKKILLVCTAGVLEQESVIRALISVMEMQAMCLPVVVDNGFEFPMASYKTGHSMLVAKVHDHPEEAEALSQDIIDIFKVIAVHFPASTGSQTELDTQAKEIARRLKPSGSGRVTFSRSESLRFSKSESVRMSASHSESVRMSASPSEAAAELDTI